MGKKRKPVAAAIEKMKDVKSNNESKKQKKNESCKKIEKKANEKNTFSDESSCSSSDSEVKKKNSESDSDSDSGSSESEEALVPKKPEPPINEIVNSSPVKRYEPPTSHKSSSSDSYHSDTEEEDKKRRKKQKKQMKIQLNKKLKRSPSVRTNDNIKEEFFDIEIKQEMDDENDIVASHNDDVPDWPEVDYVELIKRMETQLPAKDNQKFDSRAAKLDWDQIAFNDYTPRECADTWNRISKRIRRFRILQEMLNDAKEWVTKPWTNFYRGSKKNRHPDMPTRPLSTYMIYYLEQKDKVVKENPGMDMTQVSKIISEMYKNLPTSDREKYTEKAAKERATFDEKLTEFYKEHPEMATVHTTRAAPREISSKGPRKPMTPFKMFVQEQLKMHGNEPNLDKRQIEDQSKEKWRSMSDKKKLVWINWSLEDAKRYDEELKAYMMEHPEFVAPNVGKSILNKDERLIKERLAGKPIKPPNSAYSLFSRICLQSDKEVKSIPPKLRMAEISRKWKEKTEAEKRRYEDMVRELQDNYKLEFASYLEGLPQDQRAEELQKNQPRRKQAARNEEKPPRRRATQRAAKKNNDTMGLNLYKGEPAPPPVKAYDLFLKTFLLEKPPGTSEAVRLQEAPKYWEILPETKKEIYRKKLEDMKQKYIQNYEIFLKGLSPEELKEFSVLKAKAKKMEEAQEQLSRFNGRLSDSNESDSNESSSGSDSEDSDSGKSSKSTSSSDDSDN